MKKGMVVIVVFLMGFLLFGCKANDAISLRIALFNMNRLDSYKVKITTTYKNTSSSRSDSETVESYMYVDGDYMEMEVYNETTRYQFIDDECYKLINKFNLNVALYDETMNVDSEDYDDFKLYFDEEYYKDDDGYFVFDDEIFEGIETIKIYVENMRIYDMILIGSTTVSDINYDIEVMMSYYDFNDIDLDEPSFYILEEKVDELDNYLSSQNFSKMQGDDAGFKILGFDKVLDCTFENTSCRISSGIAFGEIGRLGEITYKPTTKIIIQSQIDYEISDYISNTDNPLELDAEFFDYISEIYGYYDKTYNID